MFGGGGCHCAEQWTRVAKPTHPSPRRTGGLVDNATRQDRTKADIRSTPTPARGNLTWARSNIAELELGKQKAEEMEGN